MIVAGLWSFALTLIVMLLKMLVLMVVQSPLNSCPFVAIVAPSDDFDLSPESAAFHDECRLVQVVDSSSAPDEVAALIDDLGLSLSLMCCELERERRRLAEDSSFWETTDFEALVNYENNLVTPSLFDEVR